MKYLIFGAGKIGKIAMDYLGHPRVWGFLDTYLEGVGYGNKPIFLAENIDTMDLSDVIIVVASEKYGKEMIHFLNVRNITRFFVFSLEDVAMGSSILPHYYLNKQFESVSYNRVLANMDLSKYKKISILGINCLLPYLLSEIAFQYGYEKIDQIICLDNVRAETIGLQFIEYSDYKRDSDCMLINVPRSYLGLSGILSDISKSMDVFFVYDADLCEKSFTHDELKRYKNLHKGRRIFVIGNGPSLQIDDLEKIQDNGEICIAFNKIYRVYEKTRWRATYLAMYDQNIVEDCIGEVAELIGECFIGDSFQFERPEKKTENIQYIHVNNADREYLPNMPGFSEDITKGVFDGYTVTYTIGIQMAVYLGAAEIILIGCDHSFSADVTDETNHFFSYYHRENEKEKYRQFAPAKVQNEMAYRAAKQYCDSKGINILNATRGGALEVFERVNFDDLFRVRE